MDLIRPNGWIERLSLPRLQPSPRAMSGPSRGDSRGAAPGRRPGAASATAPQGRSAARSAGRPHGLSGGLRPSPASPHRPGAIRWTLSARARHDSVEPTPARGASQAQLARGIRYSGPIIPVDLLV
jgi:hypothetical protein